MRLGYIDIDYKYSRSGWFVGPGEPIDSTPSATQLDELRSLYLKLGIHY